MLERGVYEVIGGKWEMMCLEMSGLYVVSNDILNSFSYPKTGCQRPWSGCVVKSQYTGPAGCTKHFFEELIIRPFA